VFPGGIPLPGEIVHNNGHVYFHVRNGSAGFPANPYVFLSTLIDTAPFQYSFLRCVFPLNLL